MVERRPASLILGGVGQIAGLVAHHGDNARDVAMQIGPALKCCGDIGEWSQGQDRQRPSFQCGEQCNDAVQQGGPRSGSSTWPRKSEVSGLLCICDLVQAS